MHAVMMLAAREKAYPLQNTSRRRHPTSTNRPLYSGARKPSMQACKRFTASDACEQAQSTHIHIQTKHTLWQAGWPELGTPFHACMHVLSIQLGCQAVVLPLFALGACACLISPS